MDLFVKRALEVFASNDVRFDSNETAFLERELTQLRVKTYDVLYGANLGRGLIPKNTDIAPSVTNYTYKVYDQAGQAKLGGHGTDDPPRVDIHAKEVPGYVYPVIDSYGWNIDELAEAVRTKVSLSDKLAKSARGAIERAIDDMLFNGVPKADEGKLANVKTRGLSNNADIEGNGIATLTDWDQATPVADIQAEIYALLAAVRTQSLQNFEANSLALPLNRYDVISQRPVGVDNQMTILESLLKNNPMLKEVVPWYKLDTAGANSTGRAVALDKNSEVLEAIIPMEFTQLPPQARNYEFVVPCRARCGGVDVYQPVGAKYGDFPA